MFYKQVILDPEADFWKEWCFICSVAVVVSHLRSYSRTVEFIDDINWPATGFFINPSQILTNERLPQNNHAAKESYGGDGTCPCDYGESWQFRDEGIRYQTEAYKQRYHAKQVKDCGRTHESLQRTLNLPIVRVQ